MKKFLVIAPYQYLPYFSGGQKSIAQFLAYLGKESDLTVVSVADNDSSLINTYKYLPWLKSKSVPRYTDVQLVSKLTKLIKAEKFDAAIWEHPYYAWLASIIKNRTRVKTMLHIHNIESERFHSMGKWWWWILKIYEKWFYQKADEILFVSPEDRTFAIEKWSLKPEKCTEVAFGVAISTYPHDKQTCKERIKATHHMSDDEKILLFNGLLDYKPNLDALLVILKEINPVLLMKRDLRYKIVICGKRLPRELNELRDYGAKNIIYAGFVEDIETYFKGADLFLNPVQTGGGIKTKMVESIAFGTTVITTDTGSTGIYKNICGNKLVVVPDNDWKAFSEAIMHHVDRNEITPPSYYQHYYWGNIVKKILL